MSTMLQGLDAAVPTRSCDAEFAQRLRRLLRLVLVKVGIVLFLLPGRRPSTVRVS